MVLITNAPRPGEVVMAFLDRLQVPRAAYDAHRQLRRRHARRHRGARRPERLSHRPGARPADVRGLDARMAPLESADYVVCSGLFDDTTETPQDYAALIATMRERGLAMVCANPDIVVERGDKLVYCAGAIADLYAAAGGNVLYAGKPYRPIYEQALALRAAAARPRRRPARVLAIGDSVRTDLKGAAAFGHRLPVRDRRHPCRGARRARADPMRRR